MPSWGSGWSAGGIGGGGGSLQAHSFSEPVPNPALEKSALLVPDQLSARLSLEKAQLETPGTELWLVPGIILLAWGCLTSLPAHGEFLDENGHMTNDLQSQELSSRDK